MNLRRALMGAVLGLSLGIAPAADAQVRRPSPGFKSGFKFLGAPTPPPGALTFINATQAVATTTGSGTMAVNMTGSANGDLLFVSTTNNGGPGAIVLTGTTTTCPQLDTTRSDGAFSYGIFVCPLTSSDRSNGNITYTGFAVGYDINTAIYRGGATPSVDGTNGWATAVAGNTNAWGGVPATGSPVGFVIVSQGYAYNVANTVTCTPASGPATWTMDVQNVTDATVFFGNYFGHSTNYTNVTTNCVGYGTQVKGGWIIRIDP